MIEKTIETWHRIVRGEFPGGLDEAAHASRVVLCLCEESGHGVPR